MNENDILSQNFSDIPALGDVQGLESYLNNEALAAQGLQPAQTPQPTETPAAPAATTTTPATPATNASEETITLTKEQLNAILASRGQAPATNLTPAPAPTPTPKSTGYSVQEQQFISRALAQGYSLAQINNFLEQHRNPQQNAANTELAQRLNNIEQHLKNQEYIAAETAFIEKLSNFGNKWGLSEQDLVTFGNEALKHGINIATGNVNLETVFRAVYPEQYAIRSRRMTPTSTSQIYGGTSIPESSRMQSSKMEDAYVEAFLKGAMPNQYAAFNKK